MSKKIENQCVDCGLPCLGESCSCRNVRVFYCDMCGSEDAVYRIYNNDYCEECAKKYLKDSFDELTLSEKAEILNIDILNTEDIY